MKKLISVLKKVGIALLSLVLLFTVILASLYLIYNEELPTGKQPEAADELAQKMLRAINYEAYKNTRFIEWTFAGERAYKWNKQQHLVDVKWEDYLVRLNTQNTNLSTVFQNDIEISDSRKAKLIDKAEGFFNNDSFWLVAPHKVFDPGTERQIVPLENGEEGLLVSYTSGGSTPGDSYLWILDESGLPKAFKMWVTIIPIGGLEATWDSWETTESGALLPKSHQFMFLTIPMGDVKAY